MAFSSVSVVGNALLLRRWRSLQQQEALLASPVLSSTQPALKA
jgi:hypothetical protein